MAQVKVFEDNNGKKVEIKIKRLFSKNKIIIISKSKSNNFIIFENDKKILEANIDKIKLETKTSFFMKFLSPIYFFIRSHKESKLIISYLNQKYEIRFSKLRGFLKNLSPRESLRGNLNFKQINYIINFLDLPNPFTKTEIYSRKIRTYFIRISLIFIIIIIPLIVFFDIQKSSGLSLRKFISILLGI